MPSFGLSKLTAEVMQVLHRVPFRCNRLWTLVGRVRLFSSGHPCTKHRLPNQDDIRAFRSILGGDPTAVVQDGDELRHRNVDWTRHYTGRSELLLQPSTVDQVAQIAAYCHAHHLPLVPQGGRTGLVGGGVPVEREILLSLGRLNQIHGIDAASGVLRAQAGCVLQDLQTYCADRGYLVPVDLGAKGSCQIGGNVATNAGGQYYYRYGSLAGNLLGLEVVLADGRVLPCRSNIKDNTGYKLHQLFVGSEGTLGIITAVALLCPPLPRSKQALFLACETYANVLAVMALAKSLLGEILAAFEWMDQAIVRLLHASSLRIPLELRESDRYYILLETHGSHEDHDSQKLGAFLGRVLSEALVADGVQAQDLAQVQAFWRLREAANPAIAGTGYTYKYDVSLPVDQFEAFIEDMRRHLAPLGLRHGNWGHILDGNLHFNVCRPGLFEPDPQVLARLEPHLFQRVRRLGGSISAEHGLGQAKRRYLPMAQDGTALAAMRQVKDLFDPHHILNPHKVLPDEEAEAEDFEEG